MSDLDDLRSRLEVIAEELGDQAIGLLRDALRDPDRRVEAAAAEKRIQRARRSIDKAIHILDDRGAFDD